MTQARGNDVDEDLIRSYISQGDGFEFPWSSGLSDDYRLRLSGHRSAVQPGAVLTPMLSDRRQKETVRVDVFSEVEGEEREGVIPSYQMCSYQMHSQDVNLRSKCLSMAEDPERPGSWPLRLRCRESLTPVRARGSPTAEGLQRAENESFHYDGAYRSRRNNTAQAYITAMMR